MRWLSAASESSGVDPRECVIDASSRSLAAVIDSRTKVVAIGAASNGVGTVHDITAVCRAARDVGVGVKKLYILGSSQYCR